MNTEIKDLRKTFEKDNVKVTVEWHLDDTGDISHYGEYTSDSSADYVVDRESGFLLGDHVPEPSTYDYLPDEYAEVDEYDVPDEVWDEAEAKWDEAYDEWADTPQREVLAANLSTMGRHEYRYFVPTKLALSDGLQGVGDEAVSQHLEKIKSKLERYGIDTGNKRLDLATFYACQDYERVEALSRGDWCYMGCVVKVEVGGVEIGYAGLWGIESDSDDGYLREVEREIITEAMDDMDGHVSILMAAVLEVENLTAEEVVEGLEN